MYLKFNKYLSSRYLPRWVVFLFDLFIVLFSFFASYYLRYNFDTSAIKMERVILQTLFAMPVIVGGFVIFKPFNGIIRHTATRDIQRIVSSLILSSGILTIITLLTRIDGLYSIFSIPFSVIIIFFVLSAFLMTWTRLLIRLIYQNLRLYNKKEIRVMIMGAGELGQVTMTALERSVNPNYKVFGFIDDNKHLQGKAKAGIPIYSLRKAFSTIIQPQHIDEIILAVNRGGISEERVHKLIDLCLKRKIVIKEIPPVNDWLTGGLNAKQLRQMNIEDLLGREVITLDTERIRGGLKESVILVTGGAGSIGSELVRQLLAFDARIVVIVDQAESALFDLQNELLTKGYNNSRFAIAIGDVTNFHRMVQLFERYHPDLVFNAAAYKHVPMMEDNPYEAIRVNIGGTQLLTQMSITYKVKKFVMISTDKAVNPTNVMGASKRICEMYIQSQSQLEGMNTQFITTRFGNVLGSNGSVVPLFRKQIAAGGPITLTHRDITRYFMTIPEACQLVLEAGFMGSGGEIYVFDMGKPMKIYDLAVKMITLAGLEPGRDIEIIETGLRPGEKLFEELMATKENTLPTYHKKIMIGKTRECNPILVHHGVISLLNLLKSATDDQLVSEMKKLVPEFISQNSTFERLDHDVTEEKVLMNVPVNYYDLQNKASSLRN
ncbi:MAG TPA: nucleoside-diphosphate sugar epimerase/dehydratase [Prolixibacteraceae bacterium]|nr:nucleoside-diphosphate sugar epimerase/dehydratase [Prolixibacteraceae bacterium]